MRRRFRDEMMDRPGLDPALLGEDLRNLEVLNRLFGGRTVVRRQVREFLGSSPAGAPARVLDVGSGAGDLCRVIVEECRRRGRPLRLVSLDAHPQVQDYARARLGNDYPEVRFARGDARRMPFRDGAFDLALCTLALHHFTEEDAVAVLSEMRRVSGGRAAASDLARGRLAYAAVWLATRFTQNPITRYDGPVSVGRAFTGAELRELARRAGWEGARLRREPWFRQSIVAERCGG